MSPVLCMHSISWGLNFCMPEKQWRTHFLIKHYKTTLVDLFTLSNFAFIHFFPPKKKFYVEIFGLKIFLVGILLRKKGWGGSVTIPPVQCSLLYLTCLGLNNYTSVTRMFFLLISAWCLKNSWQTNGSLKGRESFCRFGALLM